MSTQIEAPRVIAQFRLGTMKTFVAVPDMTEDSKELAKSYLMRLFQGSDNPVFVCWVSSAEQPLWVAPGNAEEVLGRLMHDLASPRPEL